MPSNGRKPNIVFVVLDTHRWDRLGCYGYSRDTSPNLDAFAEQATLFENAIAPAQWTIPSHASMFTGEPPSVHRALQSDDVLNSQFKTLAEHLREQGYRTVGFCNNPLVGILDNDLRRGFDAFYNYGGAFPAGPEDALADGFLTGMWHLAGRSLRKIAQPIQNAFARSDTLFQGALDPFWVPIWTWVANFKGNTPRSIKDVTRYIERRVNGRRGGPQFLFVNLMETHLPYTPPRSYVETFAPTYVEGEEGRNFVQDFNRRAADWFTPPVEPFSELEKQALGEMYDAEVAYQDHLLAQLLEAVDGSEKRDNTMVVLVGDHGEMLGEHRLMGHAFGVYEELIHVPLLIRLPGQSRRKRIVQPVSATRLFQTTLDAAGVKTYEDISGEQVAVEETSLRALSEGGDDQDASVVSEAYAPTFAVQVMERRKQALIDELQCRVTHRAAYEGEHKLISVEGAQERLFCLTADPLELNHLDGADDTVLLDRMREELRSFLEKARVRTPAVEGGRAANADNAAVQQRLRDLGYLE